MMDSSLQKTVGNFHEFLYGIKIRVSTLMYLGVELYASWSAALTAQLSFNLRDASNLFGVRRFASVQVQ